MIRVMMSVNERKSMWRGRSISTGMFPRPIRSRRVLYSHNPAVSSLDHAKIRINPQVLLQGLVVWIYGMRGIGRTRRLLRVHRIMLRRQFLCVSPRGRRYGSEPFVQDPASSG